MTVEEALTIVDQAPEESVLVAKAPLTWGAEAMFVELNDNYGVPQPVKDAGYEYVLGLDDIKIMLAFLKKKKVSSRTATEFIIHYGVHDAIPAWIDDIPDI